MGVALLSLSPFFPSHFVTRRAARYSLVLSNRVLCSSRGIHCGGFLCGLMIQSLELILLVGVMVLGLEAGGSVVIG